MRQFANYGDLRADCQERILRLPSLWYVGHICAVILRARTAAPVRLS